MPGLQGREGRDNWAAGRRGPVGKLIEVGWGGACETCFGEGIRTGPQSSDLGSVIDLFSFSGRWDSREHAGWGSRGWGWEWGVGGVRLGEEQELRAKPHSGDCPRDIWVLGLEPEAGKGPSAPSNACSG